MIFRKFRLFNWPTSSEQNRRLEICLTFGLLSCIGCVFGFSLENSVRSANNGSELGLAILLIVSLILTGLIALYLAKTDNRFAKVTNSKFQVCIEFILN
jgi:hypothetical protein